MIEPYLTYYIPDVPDNHQARGLHVVIYNKKKNCDICNKELDNFSSDMRNSGSDRWQGFRIYSTSDTECSECIGDKEQ